MRANNLKAVISIMFISMLMMTNLTMAQKGNGNGNGNGNNGSSYSNCNYNGNGNGNGKRGNNTNGCMQNGDRMLNNIPDITDAQKDKITKLRLELKKDMLPLRNKFAEQKAKLNTLSTADKADINEINKQIDKINMTKTQMMKRGAKMKQDVRNILTEDQRVYFDSRKGNRNGKGRGNRGYKGNCGSGCNR